MIENLRHRTAASALLLAPCLLAGCASGPRGAYFDPAASTTNEVVLPAGSSPRIALIGRLVEEHEDPSRHVRRVHDDQAALTPLLGAVSDGLRVKPSALTFRVVAGPPLPVDCALPGPGAATDPADAPCKLPARLAPEVGGTASDLRDFTHLLLVVGWTARTTGAPSTTWGIGPGVPAVTAETSFNVYVKVVAKLYELRSGAALTEASAIDGGSGAYGVMMTLLPFYTGPDTASLLDATGRAVGAEIARRLRVAGPGAGP